VKKFNLFIAGAVLALMPLLSGCDYINTGIVKDREIRRDGIEIQYWLQVEKAVSHDTDARHWVQVGSVVYGRCDYNEEWIKANIGGCDARVRDNPPGW
jgi:hypothetical protein